MQLMDGEVIKPFWVGKYKKNATQNNKVGKFVKKFISNLNIYTYCLVTRNQ